VIHLIHQGLPWFLSAITLLGVGLLGRQRVVRGWQVGILANSAWVVFDVWWRAWGLIPLSAALLILYTWELVSHHRRQQKVYPTLKVPCDLCGGAHVPNGISLPCVPYDQW